jgi:hypothetical protein
VAAGGYRRLFVRVKAKVKKHRLLREIKSIPRGRVYTLRTDTLKKKGRVHYGSFLPFSFLTVAQLRDVVAKIGAQISLKPARPSADPCPLAAQIYLQASLRDAASLRELDMKLISETTKLKFAVLCIGGNLTMDIDDAIRAADLLQCKDVMGVHYDTFPLIEIDHAAAKEKFRSKGLTLHLLPIGGTQDF